MKMSVLYQQQYHIIYLRFIDQLIAYMFAYQPSKKDILNQLIQNYGMQMKMKY